MTRLESDAAVRTHTPRPTSGPTDAPPKFALRGVNFWYPGRQALCDVSLTVPERSVVALIGPSGCGKTTLLKLLNRMHDPLDGTRHTGEVCLDGRDIYSPGVDPVAVRRRIGMVFQRSNPFPKTVYENVAFGPRVAGVRDRGRLDYLVERSLKQAALWDEVKDRLPSSALALSGGQQQRLCIARALATEPEVLLMDEPASALDPRSTSKIEDLIDDLKRDLTVIIVTHNMQQAARVSDITAFLYDGRLIETAPTRQLFTKPATKQTEDYITGRFG